jgi:predicted nuclease of restriction endonuclease-like (RecB) superfamily
VDHHLIILDQSKSAEERDFYLRLVAQERWSKRELERQFKLDLFERVVLSPPRVSSGETKAPRQPTPSRTPTCWSSSAGGGALRGRPARRPVD